MVELVKELVEKSDSYIGPNPSMGEKFVSGLQDFVPEKGRLVFLKVSIGLQKICLGTI